MAEDKKPGVPVEEQKPEPPAPEVPGSPPAPEQGAQAVIPGMEGSPAPENKVIDLSSVRAGAGQEQQAAPAPEGGQEWEKPQEEEKKPRRGRRPKDKEAPPPPAPEQPPQPRDASRGEKEEIVYLDLSELHPFQNHPFGVRDDVEMQGLVASVQAGGVHQPALVRPREGGGYEIIAGHRRQRASELAGFKNMSCIVRNMTDDEAILAMTDDNLRHRETILPSEKAAALQQQYEAIKHQGARSDGADVGKLSLDKVGERNGMSGKTVQRYIYLNDLVPTLKQLMDGGKLSFTPAVEVSRIRPKHQEYIAVSIEGQQSSPSKAQAKKLREMDEKNSSTRT